MTPPAGFEWVREGRAVSWVRADLRVALIPVLREAREHGALHGGRALAGGRGGAVAIRATDREVVVRPYRRGGLPARLLRDAYLGLRARPFRELCVMETLRRRGAPVVEVYAAAAQWIVPGCYRGWLVTRYVAGAQTLWQWASATAPASTRDAVFQQVGKAVRQLHESGARHPDLNLNNILICPPTPSAPTPQVLFIDFDQPRLAAPLSHDTGADLVRLARSARKLDPHATQLTAADLARIEAAYRS